MPWRLSLVVLAVVLANLVFGLDWNSAPRSPPRTASHDAQPAPLPAQPPPIPDDAAARNAPPDAVRTAPLAQAIDKPVAPNCNVSACEDAYRSFRASDCTYQPSSGGRRRCTKR